MPEPGNAGDNCGSKPDTSGIAEFANMETICLFTLTMALDDADFPALYALKYLPHLSLQSRSERRDITQPLIVILALLSGPSRRGTG